MKKRTLIYLTFGILTAHAQHTINPIVGDTSWIEQEGKLPTGKEPPDERIKAHLQYALEKVEANPISDSSLIENRRKNLAHLQDYINLGKFPENTKYKYERRPCFIDDAGTICAVGYLVQETAGRSLAEEINTKFQYAFLEDMNDPDLMEWQKSSGLSVKELATIQPTYGYSRGRTPIPPPSQNHFEVFQGFFDYQYLNNKEIFGSLGCQFDFPLWRRRTKFSFGGHFSVFQNITQEEGSLKDEQIQYFKFNMIPLGIYHFKNTYKMQFASYGGVGIETRNYELNKSLMADLGTVGDLKTKFAGRVGFLYRYYFIKNLGVSANVGWGGPLFSVGIVYQN
ncbi:MAG: hypothetical protein MRY83_08755 [Flavobacteriales bacterium]|nr:hypothetical protein [Flavobacteriales bacterium]